LHPKISASK
jgi:hypothetical protein